MKTYRAVLTTIFIVLICQSLWANDLLQEESSIHFKTYLLSSTEETTYLEDDSVISEKQWLEDASKKYENDLLMGYFIAAVPGLIVHGAGNMYAGRIGTGLTLFSLELISIIGGIRSAFRGVENNGHNNETKELAIEIGSYILFFGTWIYDIVTVGGQIKKRHPEGVQLNFGVLPTLDENKNNRAFGIKLGVRF